MYTAGYAPRISREALVQFALRIGHDADVIVRVGTVSASLAPDVLAEESVCDVQRTTLEC